jgi:hypothetical protein
VGHKAGLDAVVRGKNSHSLPGIEHNEISWLKEGRKKEKGRKEGRKEGRIFYSGQTS